MIMLISYPRSGNNALWGNVFIGGGFTSFLLIAVFTGGIHSSVIPWFVSVSIAGFLFANRKSGLFWTSLSLVTITTLYVLDAYNVLFPIHYPPKFESLVYFLSYLGSAIYVILVILGYEFLSTKKQDQLKRLLQLKKEFEEELLQQQEEIKAQRDRLLESEQMIRRILEAMPDPAFMIDQNGVVTMWNKALEEMTGVKAEDILGKGNYEYSRPFYGEPRPILIDLAKIDDDYLKKNYSNIKKIGDILQAETYVPSLRGKERYLIGRAIALYSQTGDYIGAVEVIHDYTEKKKAFEKIEQQQQQLWLLSLVASETHNVITIMKPDGRLLWVNKPFTKAFGYSNQDLDRGISIFEFSNIPDFEKRWEKMLVEKRPLTYENEFTTEQGEKRYTQTTLSPVLDEQGNVTHVIGINSDITVLKNALIELQENREELIQQKEEIATQRDRLYESEQMIRKIMEAIPDPAFMINQNGVVTYWNDALEEMTGVKAEDILGKGDYEYARPFYGEARPILIDLAKLDDDYLREHYTQIQRSGNILQAESYVPSLRGKERYLIGRAIAIYSPTGEYIGAVEVIHDFTEKKKAFEKIEQQKQQLELLSLVASKTQNAIAILLPNGQFIWVNSSFTKIYGYNNDDVNKGLSLLEISNNPHIKELWNKIISTKQSLIYENQSTDKEGNTFYTQTTLSPILDNNGNITKIIAIDTDITLLKDTLEELKQSREELQQQKEEIAAQRDRLYESEQMIRKIMEAIPDPAFMINQNGVVTYWNDALEEMTGVKAEDILGKGDYEYARPFYGEARPILIDLAKLDDNYLREHYTQIQRFGNILQAESYVPSLRGKERYLIGRAIAIYNNNGDYIGAVEVIHDFTEKKKAFDKIEAQKRNIESSIQYASRIQQAIFPSVGVLNKYLEDYFIFFKPRNIVSGDFYWIAEVNGNLFVTAADCTGHGVPGAFMSMLGISYLNEIVYVHGIESPDQILNLLRDKIIKSLHEEGGSLLRDGMDLALCKVYPKERKIEYAGAYNPLVMIRGDNIITIKADKLPIGHTFRKGENTFTIKSINIHPEDKFYIYSDGYQDQLNSKSQKIYSRNFKELLQKNSHLSFNEQKAKLEEFLQKWKGSSDQTDDILVIGFQVKL